MERNKNEQDELKLYRGMDWRVNDAILVRQPTLGSICEYGEQEYFSMVHTLCSVGADLKWQLAELGVDYTKVSDYELFLFMLTKGFTKAQTEILLGDTLDFSRMQIMFNRQIQENVLVQLTGQGKPMQIDRYAYTSLVRILRKMHMLKRNDEVPGNEATRQILIEEAKEKAQTSRDKPFKSFLLPLISAMVNSEGFKRNEQNIFDMKIYPFMDGVQRIGKIKNAQLLLQSGYSGFGVDLKKIDKEALNWMGDLN